MNAIQSLNRRKWILSIGIVVFLLLGISGCSKEKPSLKGRWEMFVGKDPSLMGQEYGVDNLTYCMELDFSERTFDTEMEKLWFYGFFHYVPYLSLLYRFGFLYRQ